MFGILLRNRLITKTVIAYAVFFFQTTNQSIYIFADLRTHYEGNICTCISSLQACYPRRHLNNPNKQAPVSETKSHCLLLYKQHAQP